MIVLVATSALLSAMLAWAWASTRGWLGYVITTVAVWAAVSALPLFAPSSETSTTPVGHQVLAGLVFLAPFAVLPLLFLVPLVVRGAATRTILIASAIASVIALPLSFFSVLYGGCYLLGECP